MLSRAARRFAALVALPVLVVACSSSEAEEPPPDTSEMVEVATTGPDAREVQAMFRTAERTEQYVFALYVSAVEWDRWWDQAMAAWNAEQARLAAASSSSYSGGGYSSGSSGSGGECGGSRYDYVMDEESGGSSTVWNTEGSGAWGCYQIMPGTWAGSCSDLGVHGQADAAAQAACADRLPASAWNASQG